MFHGCGRRDTFANLAAGDLQERVGSNVLEQGCTLRLQSLCSASLESRPIMLSVMQRSSGLPLAGTQLYQHIDLSGFSVLLISPSPFPAAAVTSRGWPKL
jgi:hypothetical protein